MLEISHITKDFRAPISPGSLAWFKFKRGPSVRALDDISFTLTRGTVTAVLGPNGAGKTTLLKIISTLISPDSGTVKVNGLPFGKDDDRIRASIGLVSSSERGFYCRLTGRQNLDFFAAMYGLDKSRANARIEELFSLFGITYGKRRFNSYSTGMQQKFALARALLHDPGMLLLDEPTKSLDYSAALAFKRLIKDVLVKRYGKTVLFTTHLMDEAIDFADSFIVLDKGKLLARGTLEELRKKTSSPSASLGEIFLKLTEET